MRNHTFGTTCALPSRYYEHPNVPAHPDQVLFQLFLIHYTTTNTFAGSIVQSPCNSLSPDSFIPETEEALNSFIPLLANHSRLEFYIDGSFNPKNPSLPGMGFAWIQSSSGYSYKGFSTI